MMRLSRMLKILRDPVWGSIGVLIGFVGVFVALAPNVPGELAVIHVRHISSDDYLLPKDRIKLLVAGGEQQSQDFVVDHFIVTNTSTRPLLAKDFVSPIEVASASSAKRILTIESCSEQLTAACAANEVARAEGAAFIPVLWEKSEDKWVATPSLLNPREESCVAVISEASVGTAAKASDRIQWKARIVGLQLRAYDSIQDFATKSGKHWQEYFLTSVRLEGLAVYWFIALQCVFFLITSFVSVRGNWISNLSLRSLFKILLVVLLSSSTAEILIDTFINRRSIADQHAVVWPLIFSHGMLIIWLAYRALRRPRGSTFVPL